MRVVDLVILVRYFFSSSLLNKFLTSQKTTHRDYHHSDFPYSAFFAMTSGMMVNHSLWTFLIFVALNISPNTLELWGLCEDKDLLEPKSTQFGINFLRIHSFTSFLIRLGKVAKLLRWNKTAPLLSENLLLVQVGSLILGQPYFFHIYTEDNLKQIGQGKHSFIVQ